MMTSKALHYSREDYLEHGFSNEQIDMWNELDYLNVEPLQTIINDKGQEKIVVNNVYDYWNDILYSIWQRKKLPINELDLCGSRLSGKTYHTVREAVRIFILAIKMGLKVACYGFRKLGADVQEFKKEWDTALNQYNMARSEVKTSWSSGSIYTFRNTNNSPFYSFIGGSFIQLKGLTKANNDKVSLKGLASAEGYDLAIKVKEEANELTKEDFEAVNMGVRSAKQELDVNMSNPDSPYQYFINYCMERVPFNLETMKTKGQQFKMIVEHKQVELFHYTNYTTNPYLTYDKVQQLQKLKDLDPYRYMSWGYGIPATPDEAIFARYLNEQPASEYDETQSITAGIDLGQADGGHPTAAILTGEDRHRNLKVLGEYFHSNDDMHHLDPQDIAKEIIDFFIKPYREFVSFDRKVQSFSVSWNDETSKKYDDLRKQAELYSNGLVVNVDYGAGGAYMIDILNTIVQEQYKDIDWLSFRPVDKSVWFIKDRIDATITLLTGGVLTIDKELTPNLVRQMNLMKYKLPTTERSKHDLEIIDINDDTWDAFCYSVMPRLKSIVDKVKTKNQFLVSKGK